MSIVQKQFRMDPDIHILNILLLTAARDLEAEVEKQMLTAVTESVGVRTFTQCCYVYAELLSVRAAGEFYFVP